jgi:hypothetical protein
MYELCVRVSLQRASAFCDICGMNQSSDEDWLPGLLAAGSFLGMLLTSILAFFDALDGSRWTTPEFGLASLCGVSFASLLAVPGLVGHLSDRDGECR